MRSLLAPLYFLLMVWGVSLYAQTPLPTEKTHYVDSLNRYYQQTSLPIYLYISHKPSPEGATQLHTKTEAIHSPEPMYLDGDGMHYLRHFDAIDKVAVDFVIYGDGKAPNSSDDFVQAPSYTSNGITYYGKNLQVVLTTKDDMSGVKDFYASRNAAAYAAYAAPLVFEEEGEQTLNYYATDNVGNREEPQQKRFTVDLSPPETYHNVTGVASGNIISTSTKIYLTYQDNLSGVAKTFYRLDGGKWQPYNGTYVPFMTLEDGDHVLEYYSTDHVQNAESPKSYAFYLDKTAPITASDVLGDRFIAEDNQVYFSGRTKLKLTAVDNKSGVKEILYSIDGEPFQPYTDPFYLPSKSGVHTIRFFALDNMDNKTGTDTRRYEEYRHNVSKVYVDLTGPALSYSYRGPKFGTRDTIFINGQTEILLSAKDAESGLQKITYTLNNEGEEIPYSQPFKITESGVHRIDYFGYDNVNNRNRDQFYLFVDNDPPRILPTFSISPVGSMEGQNIYPKFVTVFLAATDQKVGYQKIRYRINGGPEKSYTGLIQGFQADTDYRIEVFATDNLGNESVEEIRFRTAAGN
ncbi:MAG: OmpL47-type beta-barrel domain-containing protein [Bernardetiaceae bacterium]